MKKYFSLIFLAAALTGCMNENKVIINGTCTSGREGMVYLEQVNIEGAVLVDSATIKKGGFTFKTEVIIPEFYQVRTGENDFVSLLCAPGERIELSLGGSPLILDYSVAGSPGSEQILELDKELYKTREKLDSLKNEYNNLSENELADKGPALEQLYLDVIKTQRKNNITFIIENSTSLAALKAAYQRIDDRTYVLYQPRDLQYLKIISDSLSVKYPASPHVRALTDNVASELNQMYMEKLATIAAEAPSSTLIPDLPGINGENVSLASLKGKYVLVTFWSVNSEACLANNNTLKNIYRQYKSEGLEIYQINIDNDIARWKEVVRFEEIPWISVREENPASPKYTIAYNVTQLPSNILYDREGNIVTKDLFGRNLNIKMRQIFNK